MNNSIKYRQKNKYLIYGMAISVVIMYLMSISNTIKLYSENIDLEKALITYKNSESKHNDIKNRSEEINAQVKKYFADSTTHDEALIKVVSELCHSERVLLKDLPLIEKHRQGNYHIFTNRITLEGGYHSLLKILYQLETKHSVGRIASADFKIYKDHKKKKDVLMLIIYIQTIIS